MSRTRRTLSALLAAPLLLAGLAFSGCSISIGTGDNEASGEEIADEVRSDYRDQTGLALKQLTCEGVKGEVGARFKCSGSNSRGVKLQIAGRVTDAESGGFDYSWHVAKALAPGVLYERALRREIEAHGVVLSEVRCPVEVEVEVGRTIRCEASDREGEARAVAVTLTDLDGGFEFHVEGGPGEGAGSGEEGEQSAL